MENVKNSEIPYSPDNGNMWNTSNNGFDSVGRSKVDALKGLVDEVDGMIREREFLSEKFIREGESMKQSINNFLLENAPKGEDDSEFARERAELRKKQIEISEMQLNEKVGCWRDIAILKRELRESTRELNEKTSRADMLGKILGE